MQVLMVTGYLINELGKPIPGAAIFANQPGATAFALTDANGAFVLAVPENANTRSSTILVITAAPYYYSSWKTVLVTTKETWIGSLVVFLYEWNRTGDCRFSYQHPPRRNWPRRPVPVWLD